MKQVTRHESDQGESIVKSPALKAGRDPFAARTL